MDFLGDYRWKLIAITIVLMLGITFLEDFRRDRGQHHAAKALHAIFLIAYSLYALRYFEMLGRLQGLGVAFHPGTPAWAKVIQLLGVAVVVTGVFSAIAAFMMRGRWNLARRLFMWIVLGNGIVHTVLAFYLIAKTGYPIWNRGGGSFMVLWLPLAIAVVANVLYRLPLMRAFFGYRQVRTFGEDTIDDVVMESETERFP